MKKTTEAQIVLSYSGWLYDEAKKTGHSLNQIGDVVRRYENRIKATKKSLFRELKSPSDIKKGE